MSRPWLLAAALTVLCSTLLLVGAVPAFAHTRLLSTDPADGASLATAPQRVSLTFNENMQAGFTTITVVGPDQRPYQTGEITTAGGTVSIGVLPLGPAGRYEIGYRVVSDDGHPVSGSVAFTLTAPGAGTAQPAPAGGAGTEAPAPATAPSADAPDDGGSAVVWPWIVGAVVLVGGGVAAALRLGRG